MKIGKFAENNNLSIDTIRHYMNLGLIITEKNGGQYTFGDKCQKDLDYIMYLKNMGLALNEIKHLMKIQRLGKFNNSNNNMFYKSLFINKYNQITDEIRRLNLIKGNLKKEIYKLSENIESKECILGVDFEHIKLIRCTKCKGKLTLTSDEVKNNKIINGKLKCSCGQIYDIKDGILLINNEPKKVRDIVEINDYISSTDESFTDSLSKSVEWSKKRFLEIIKNDVVLELGSGYGFFLRAIYEDLPDDCTFISVDNNLEVQKFLKQMIEYTGITKNVLFISTDFLEIPILEKSIDILIDCAATSNYGFENDDFLLNKIDYLIKDNSILLAAYILFDKFNFDNILSLKKRENFKLECIKSKIDRLNYLKLDDNISKLIDKGGKYEDFFSEGEIVYHYNYIGKR